MTPVEYVERAKWALVPIPPGTKGPNKIGWNRLENCITDTAAAEHWQGNVGLAHAYSGTCAIDIDDLERARTLLADHGVDLNALLESENAVRIESGKPNRAKLLYSLAEPLATHTVTIPHPEKADKRITVLEFRCATSTGLTVQDILPPSRLDDGRCYTWNVSANADPLTPPPLPDALRALWGSLSAIDGAARAPAPVAESLERYKAPAGLSEEQSRQVLRAADPDEYHTWIRAGQALQHEHGDAGFALWLEFSQRSEKFPGFDECWQKWEGFGRQAGPPLTMRAFIKIANAAKPAPAAPGRRFRSAPLCEFVKAPPVRWLLRGVIPQGGFGLLYAESGAGKSFFALDIGLHLAAGIPWRGTPTKASRVAYICAEGAGGFRARARACSRHLGIDLADIVFQVIADVPSLLDPEQVRALIAQLVDEGGYDVVIIDTVAQVTAGGNENSAEDVGRALAHCRALQEALDCTLVLIDHAGKDLTRGARGWSGKRAAADFEIELVRAGDARTARVTKQKDGSDGAVFHFRLKQYTLADYIDEDGQPVTSCAVEIADEPAVQERRANAAEPQGTDRQIVLRTARTLAAQAGDLEGLVNYGDLIRAAVAAMPPSDKDMGEKDRRREVVRRAVEGLIAKGWLEMVSGGDPDDPNTASLVRVKQP